MPSPFPGMDPYIEDPFFWQDFHTTTLGIFRIALNAVLPERYVAAVERHVWVQEGDPEERTLVGGPDVQVTDREQEGPGGQATATAAVVAPMTVTLPLTRRQGGRFLRILDRNRRRVVTVIELLSPANKKATGDGIAYRQKRADYLAGGVNLVEIDLLRAGTRPPMQEPPPPPSDYCILVCAAARFPEASYWPLNVRDPLPVVPIPLDEGEENSVLELRRCLDQAYDGGRYNVELPYSRPPTPPLREADAAWARELLAHRPR